MNEISINYLTPVRALKIVAILNEEAMERLAIDDWHGATLLLKEAEDILSEITSMTNEE